ncbi:hypothetical protein [Brumimicrobium mesophilum]|uniref:hypothetical protein n=1 Tax=Brumimicrobium mesophilum TaxID=392717 RepID=UPI00131ADED7|nr:hypothetical protein [Brumimicrobium mesophilum]
MDKRKIEFFKAPIMAVEYMLRSLSWSGLYEGRVKYLLFFILPYAPILIYVYKVENQNGELFAIFYMFFYLILTVILGTQIRKLAKQWPEKEYKKLNPDQVTFPFILILLLNASLHFTIFYYLIKFFVE